MTTYIISLEVDAADEETAVRCATTKGEGNILNVQVLKPAVKLTGPQRELLYLLDMREEGEKIVSSVGTIQRLSIYELDRYDRRVARTLRDKKLIEEKNINNRVALSLTALGHTVRDNLK